MIVQAINCFLGAAPAGNPYGFVATGALGSAVNATNSLSLAYPAGLLANDILIAHVAIRSGTTTQPTITAPSGWTQVGSQAMGASAEYRQFTLWKRATGSESGSLSFTWTGGTVSATAIGRISAWGGCVTSGSPIVSLAGNSGQDTTAESAAVTTSENGQIVLNLIAADDDTPAFGPPANYTEIYDTAYSSGLAMKHTANYRVIAAAGVVSSVTTTLSTSERWAQTSFGLDQA